MAENYDFFQTLSPFVSLNPLFVWSELPQIPHKTKSFSVPQFSQRRRSWIWAHASSNNLRSYGRWHCAYCMKSYKETSGTLKPMRHLESAHAIRKPVDNSRSISSSPLLQPDELLDLLPLSNDTFPNDSQNVFDISEKDLDLFDLIQTPPTTCSAPSNQRPPYRSWIWSHASIGQSGDIDRDENGHECWRCLHCAKTYRKSSGTGKPMFHLEKAHGLQRLSNVSGLYLMENLIAADE